MTRPTRGTSAREAEDYLGSAFEICEGFGLAVVTAADPAQLEALRETLVAAGAELELVAPTVEAVLEAPIVDAESEGARPIVRWVEGPASAEAEAERWREFAVALNRSREKLRREHRYLWVVAGPLELRRVLTLHAQDIYSGAYKVPHVSAHPGAAISWLHLSDLQLGPELDARWTDYERALFNDLDRQLELFEAGPELLFVSGDLARTGAPAEYAVVDEILERVLGHLEARAGRRPILLAVPGNHDLRRPPDLVARWRFEILRQREDPDSPYAAALHEQLWIQRDAGLIAELFPNYEQWAAHRIHATLEPDALGMEPGVCYLRSMVRSHVPGDWSAIVEKDDLRLIIVGLNTAWTSFVPEREFAGATLPFEQFQAALGERGLARLDEARYTLLLTHHGPAAMTATSREVLSRQIYRGEGFAAHVHGHVHEWSSEREVGAAIVGAPALLSARTRSGYMLGRIRRDARIDLRPRLATLPLTGDWRFDDDSGDVAQRLLRAPDKGSAMDLVAPEELERYLVGLAGWHEYWPSFSVQARYRAQQSLFETCVPLSVSVMPGTRGSDMFAETIRAEQASIPIAKVFSYMGERRRRGAVLLGGPATGKTSQLSWLVLALIHYGPEFLGLPPDTVPVFVALDRLPKVLVDEGLGLGEVFQASLSSLPLEFAADFGRRLSERGKLLVLLDGLDAIPDLDERARVARWIGALHDDMANSYLLVTSRYSGYTRQVEFGPEFLELHLRALEDEQIKELVRRVCLGVEIAMSGDTEAAVHRGRTNAERLLGALESQVSTSSARVYAMARNPLLLTLICLVFHEHGRLPGMGGAGFYRLCLDHLLARAFHRRRGNLLTSTEVLDVLRPVAAWMHAEHGRTRATRGELVPVIEAALAQLPGSGIDADQLLTALRDDVGLLTGHSPETFGFVYLGFQEYLTAAHLRNEVFTNPRRLELLAERFDDSWWQEVILLMVGQRNPAMFEPFMGALASQPRFPEWAESEMMHRLWAEAASPSPAPLVQLLRHEDRADATLEARQLAAARLLERVMPEALELHAAELRDHQSARVREWLRQRPAPALQDRQREREMIVHLGVELVRIPAGHFMMGSREDQGMPDEHPAHEVELDSFYLARTPVTNAQYARYLEANPDAPKPRYWSDRGYNQPEQPVVGVTWDEAQAYCAWAGLVLPTEAQWEYACRAGTATAFWSGDSELDAARVAWYRDNAGGKLHAVRNKVPNPWGLYDMHGNVREWCLDEPGPYTVSPRAGDGLRHPPSSGADGSRVHRGGGWADAAGELRSASRGEILASHRLFSLGFRPAQGHPRASVRRWRA